METKLHICLLTILLIATLCPARSASAQEDCFPVMGSEGRLKVQYLVAGDSTVQLLCRYTPDVATEGSAPYLVNVNGKTHISTPDGDYQLVNTVHIPVWDEAETRYAYIKGAQPALNCMLEFEKFPFDEAFDLVDGDEQSSLFSAQGLTVGGKIPFNVGYFLESTPYSEYGCSFKDGSPVFYFDDGGVYLASMSWPYDSRSHAFLTVGFRVENRTSAPMAFNFNDVSIQVLKRNKSGKLVKCSADILKEKQANREWQEEDETEVMMDEAPTNAGQMVANAATDVALHSGLSALGSLGLSAFGIALRAVSAPDYGPYMVERNREREELMKQYLKDTVIAPGETLNTFVSIKYWDEPAYFAVSVTLNGETYTMKYKDN